MYEETRARKNYNILPQTLECLYILDRILPSQEDSHH